MDEIIQLLMQAYECEEKASKMAKELGVTTFGIPRDTHVHDDGAKYEVCVLSGINRLAEVTNVKPYHPTNFITEKPTEEYLAITIDGIRFSQRGKPAPSAYIWE